MFQNVKGDFGFFLPEDMRQIYMYRLQEPPLHIFYQRMFQIPSDNTPCIAL